jgi:hypothetical protein
MENRFRKMNPMKTHTPGPWRVDHSGNCHIGIIDENERTIAFCALQNENSEEDESNSCLIASAPDLLSALERLTHPMADDDDLDYAREVITKAKGQ